VAEVTPVWFGPADLAYLEPESDEEAQFIKSCPPDWTWERVCAEWSQRAE